MVMASQTSGFEMLEAIAVPRRLFSTGFGTGPGQGCHGKNYTETAGRVNEKPAGDPAVIDLEAGRL